MRLSHCDLENSIEFYENRVNIIIVENPGLMSKLILDLIAQSDNMDGGFTLWDQGGVLPLNKTANVIINPFLIDINRRDVLTHLYNKMKQDAMGEDLYMHTNELLSEIETEFRKIIDSQDINLESDSPDIAGLFKLMNVRFEVSDSLLARICDYMDIFHEYLKIKLFIFVNLKSFLSESEIYQLYEHSRYHKHMLLLIESKQSISMETESVRVIDKDLCEIELFDNDYL